MKINVKEYLDSLIDPYLEKEALVHLSEAELENYEYRLKVYRDSNAVITTAYEQGKLAGEREIKRERAQQMKADGASIEKIIRYTGLSEAEIQNL